MAPTFADLGVPDPIVAVLDMARIRSPFPVQAATIPDLLDGRDVVGRAPTGSGKTLAFGIPMVASVPKADPKRPSALVLAPTRELADQIASDLRTIADAMDRKILAVYGGVGLEPQIKKLRNGIDILVATPGRLEDLIARRAVDLGEAGIVVIDEADRMADMGFMPVVKRILDQTPRERQTVLYSATLDGDVGKLIERYQDRPTRHEIGPAAPDLKAMEHHFWELPRNERVPLCASVIATFGRTIVFSRTRHGADRLARQLGRLGVKAVPIHGNRSQSQRTRALNDFANGKADALVATDVAARGIHVDEVECVVHYDPVDEDSAYVHRSGRTARAGAYGHVISFVDPGQVKLVKAMKRRLELPQEITPPPETDGALPDTPPDEWVRDEPQRGDGHKRDQRGEGHKRDERGDGHKRDQRGGERRNDGRGPRSERPRSGNRKPTKKGGARGGGGGGGRQQSSSGKSRSGSKPKSGSGNRQGQGGGGANRSGRKPGSSSGPKSRSGPPRSRSGGSRPGGSSRRGPRR